MTLDAITDTVADMAARLGWKVHHDRPARTTKGWRTAISGHAGFPDLVLVHPQRGIIFVECKGVTNRPNDQQRIWRAVLEAAGARYELWRPADLESGRIERVLRGE